MCDVEKDEGQGLPRAQTAPVSIPKSEKNVTRKCLKCINPGQVLLGGLNVYCNDCFKRSFVHKFRYLLGKHKVIDRGEKVLVALSGGPSSRALAHMVAEGMPKDSARRLHFDASALHVDESILFRPEHKLCSFSGFDVNSIKSKMDALGENCGLPCVSIPLSDVFLPEYSDSGHFTAFLQSNSFDFELNSSTKRKKKGTEDVNTAKDLVNIGEHERDGKIEDNDAKLMRLFRGLSTVTAREDLVKILKERIIKVYAKRNGFTKVLTGENATRLSINVLARVAKGRGYSLPLSVGFTDAKTFPEITTIRPMRDHLVKEIGLFNSLQKLDCVIIPTFTSMQIDMKTSSVDHLTEKFLTELQKDFPSTINTIYRTADKLIFRDDSGSSTCEYCPMCHSPLTMDEQTAALAKKLSMTTFNEESTKDNTLNECCSGNSGAGQGCSASSGTCTSNTNNCVSKNSKSHYYNCMNVCDLSSTLCYGCALIVSNEIKPKNIVLPPYAAEQVHRYVHRTNAKQKISQYLLSDSSEEEDDDSN